jgi:hypothetical protein
MTQHQTWPKVLPIDLPILPYFPGSYQYVEHKIPIDQTLAALSCGKWVDTEVPHY